jgi:hypothetical protein
MSLTPNPKSRPALGPTQSPIQCVPGVKRPGREADHSPPTSTEVKNSGAIALLHKCLHVIVLNLLSKKTTLFLPLYP